VLITSNNNNNNKLIADEPAHGDRQPAVTDRTQDPKGIVCQNTLTQGTPKGYDELKVPVWYRILFKKWLK